MIEPDARRERRNFGVRVSMLFAAIFVVAGTNLPYLPVWLDWKGLGAREIAIITATPLFIRVLVTPAIAFAADRAGDHRRFLVVLSWCGLTALVVLSQSSGFLADPDLHRGLRPGLDHDHAADRDRGAERRQGGGARLWPHAPMGIAQLCCRQPRGRLGRGALRSGLGHLAGGGWGRAHDGGRTHACPADRSRPPEGSDQPATPAHVRRCELAVFATVSDFPSRHGRDAGRACHVLHLRHAPLGQPGSVGGLARRSLGHRCNCRDCGLYLLGCSRETVRRCRTDRHCRRSGGSFGGWPWVSTLPLPPWLPCRPCTG